MIKKLFKSFVSKYYLIFIFFCVEIINLLHIYELNIKGIIFDLLLFGLIVSSVIVIKKYNDTLKCKRLILPLYVLCLCIGDKLFLNNWLYTILMVVPVVLVIGLNFHKDNFIEMSGIIAIIALVVFSPLLFFLSSFSSNVRDMIYEDTHYQCDEYEIFVYSAGAMDSYHYAVVEQHKYVAWGNLLEIWHDEYIGDTELDYNLTLKTGNCTLVN